MKFILCMIAMLALAACTPEEIALFNDVTAPTRDVLSDDQLATLRDCENGGMYESQPWHKYRGAYQFLQSTWDGVARRHYPWLEGQDPATVAPWWQDAMARALWSEAGPQPWPICGRRVS